tara:strand:- start:12572 stop:13366 length:795 start_codon:yes stop_codon:yes gene_type:complete
LAGGAIGGFFDFLNRLGLNKNEKVIAFQGAPLKGSQFLSLSAVSSALGIGGALAVQFTMIGIGKFPKEANVETIMLLFTLSVVAGFSGRKVLGIVTNKLEDQIGEAKRKSEEALEEANESNQLIKAVAMLGPHSSIGERVETVANLERMLKQNPTDRAVAILTGRLYRRDGNYASAINILSEFIENKRTKKELDKDLADVLYNRACYRVLKNASATLNSETEVMNALDDLRCSISIEESNKQDAASDGDFDSVKEHPEFIKLVS